MAPVKGDFRRLSSVAFSILKYYVPKSVISVPNAIYDMLPFVLTALILVITSIRQSERKRGM